MGKLLYQLTTSHQGTMLHNNVSHFGREVKDCQNFNI